MAPKGEAAQFWTAAAASSVHDGGRRHLEILERLYSVVGGCFTWTPARQCGRGRERSSEPAFATLPRTTLGSALDGLRVHESALRPGAAEMDGRGGRRPRRVGPQSCLGSSRPGQSPAGAPTSPVTQMFGCRGRLAFASGTQLAPFPSAIVVWSATDHHRARMARLSQTRGMCRYPAQPHQDGTSPAARTERLHDDGPSRRGAVEPRSPRSSSRRPTWGDGNTSAGAAVMTRVN